MCLSVTFVDHVKMNKRIFNFFSPSGSPAILVFPQQTSWHYCDGDPPNGGVECKGVWKKWRFSTNISLYLRNDARYSHSYYGRRIGNRTQAFEWYQFQWPWVTSNPDFKVRYYSTSNNSKKVQGRAKFTMADQQNVYGLSNVAIFNDLEQSVTHFSRSRYSLTLNIS